MFYDGIHCFFVLGVDSEELFKSICPVLVSVMTDTSASLKARASCAEALGVCCFIAVREIEVTKSQSFLQKLGTVG